MPHLVNQRWLCPTNTVILALKSRRRLSVLHAAIYPKESLEPAGDGTLKDFIGTGPLRFVEYPKPLRLKYLRLLGKDN